MICPVPEERDVKEEFQSPTALDTEGVKWRMRVVLPCLTGARKWSMVDPDKGSDDLEALEKKVREQEKEIEDLEKKAKFWKLAFLLA